MVVEKYNNNNNWRTRVNFGLEEFEIFYQLIKRVEFSCHVNFMVENFLEL